MALIQRPTCATYLRTSPSIRSIVWKSGCRALCVLGCPGEQQLAEANACHGDPGFADLPGPDLDPFDRIARVIHFHALARLELARRDAGGPILRVLAVELPPEVAVRGEVLSALLPQELQRMA
jgi:hypothetical protein